MPQDTSTEIINETVLHRIGGLWSVSAKNSNITYTCSHTDLYCTMHSTSISSSSSSTPCSFLIYWVRITQLVPKPTTSAYTPPFINSRVKCPQWRYCTYVRLSIHACCKWPEGTVSTEVHTYTHKHFPPIHKCKQVSLKYVKTLTNAKDMQTSLQGLQPYNALGGLAQAHPNYTNATIVWNFICPHLCPYSPMKPTIGLP